jgi:hypothetical protein
MKHSRETLGVIVFYRGRLPVTKGFRYTEQETRDSEEDDGQKMSRTVKMEAVNL